MSLTEILAPKGAYDTVTREKLITVLENRIPTWLPDCTEYRLQDLSVLTKGDKTEKRKNTHRSDPEIITKSDRIKHLGRDPG